jgi:predicted nucleotidyltransferase
MDIEDLLKSLNAHKVEFVIIGATAFPTHGYARGTLKFFRSKSNDLINLGGIQ